MGIPQEAKIISRNEKTGVMKHISGSNVELCSDIWSNQQILSIAPHRLPGLHVC